jgi:hypothetical protein
MRDIHRHYILDLGCHVREAGIGTRAEMDAASDDDLRFQQGRRMAYYEVLSLMQQQAIVFDLPLRDLSLETFDADRDLLKFKSVGWASVPECTLTSASVARCTIIGTGRRLYGSCF